MFTRDLEMYNLTKSQRDLLRWIVQQIRKEKLPEEFSIIWLQEKCSISEYKGNIEDDAPSITKGALDALATADLILCQIRYRATDSYGRHGQDERGRRCTLLNKAYEAIDSDFNLPIETFDKVNQPDTSSAFITVAWLPDDFYKKLIEEINLAYKYQLPIALSVLIRKLFENLIIDILRKKYGTSDLVLYYDKSSRRFQEFSALLKNFDAKKSDFHYISTQLDSKLISDINNFRETGNSGAHSLDASLTLETFKKDKINYLARLLLRLLQNI